MRVLGISTNTRLLGMAIITNGLLEDYSIRLYKSFWSPTKANLMITSLEPCVRQYCIKRVVLSMPCKWHETKGFRVLLLRLKQYCINNNIEMIAKDVKALSQYCNPEGIATKKLMMQSLAEKFPELKQYYLKEMRNRNKYYVKLFEAVGMAALLEDQLSEAV